MAAGKSGGSTGEINFLEGTSMSALAGVGQGREIRGNVAPDPGCSVIRAGWFGGGGGGTGGGGGRGDGGEGMCGESAGFPSVGARVSVWPRAGERARVERAARRAWRAPFGSARANLTFLDSFWWWPEG